MLDSNPTLDGVGSNPSGGSVPSNAENFLSYFEFDHFENWHQGDLIQGPHALQVPNLSTVPSLLKTGRFIFQVYIVWSNVIR